jgi:hypothetical protein
MMRKQVLAFLTLACFTVFFAGCAKEKSFETGFGPSAGSLQSETTGDCLPKNVAGIYEATVALNATNYIEVDVDITTAGSYTIRTDTVNGYSFSAQGYFTQTGIQTVKLTGSGKPENRGINNFIVKYAGTTCGIAVSVLPQGAGGPASFDLVGSPGNCTGAIVDGVYGEGIALNNSHTVTLNVNVTAIGVYDITTTTANGITFKGSGPLIDLGPNTITLKGSGTPTNAGLYNIAIAGLNSCTFEVVVFGPAEYTMQCSSIVVNGTYAANTSLSAGNTIKLTVDVTTVGPYSITTNTADGMTFSGSGNFSATGLTDVTLNGAGKPTTAGNKTLTITGVNGQSCTGTIAVTGPPVINWKFKVGTKEFQGTTFSTSHNVISSGPSSVAFLEYRGTNTAGDEDIWISLTDINGSINTNEEYKTTVVTSNFASFAYNIDATNEAYEADFTKTGSNMTVKITDHNKTTKTIKGTFSGTAKDKSGNNVAITSGQFEGTYP